MSFGTGSGPVAISGATDVSFGTRSDGQVLEYNGTTAKWQNVGLTGRAALPTGGGVETLNALGNKTTTATIDLSLGNVVSITLTGNVTTLTLQGATAGKACSFGLYVTYGGSFSISWPASVKWAGGTQPTQTSTTSAVDIFVFETLDGGTTWYGSQVGAAFA
jgi:hypothetical protein